MKGHRRRLQDSIDVQFERWAKIVKATGFSATE
jgi:hypothetical protein